MFYIFLSGRALSPYNYKKPALFGPRGGRSLEREKKDERKNTAKGLTHTHTPHCESSNLEFQKKKKKWILCANFVFPSILSRLKHSVYQECRKNNIYEIRIRS